MPLLALYLILPDNGFDPRDIASNISNRMKVFQIFRYGLAAKIEQVFLHICQLFLPFIRPHVSNFRRFHYFLS